MLYPLTDLVDRASLLYRSESRLREVDREQEAVRFSLYEPSIPETMTGRAFPVLSYIGAEKVDRAKVLLGSTKGLRIRAHANGDSAKAQTQKATAARFVKGVLGCNEQRSGNTLSTNLKEDLLVRSRGWLRVMPMPQLYAAVPEVDEDAEAETQKAQKAAAEKYKRRNVPVLIEHRPAEGIVFEEDHQGLRCVWDMQEWSIPRVLASFLDEDGEPIARGLAENVRAMRQELTEDDVCTVLVYADRTHMQIAVAPVLLDQAGAGRRGYASQHAVNPEIIWEGEHGLSRVPYVRFRGRELPARLPEYRYWGLLRPVCNLIRRLDDALTQQASSARMAAWPGMVIVKHQDAQLVGDEDRPQAIVLDEGGVYAGLLPGERIESPAWTNGENFTHLRDFINYAIGQIDKQTLSAASYGTSNAPSGYLNAQEQAASEHVLEEWEIGLNQGYEETSSLVMECTCVLIREGLGPIPVLYTDAEGSEYVTVDAEIAEQEWEFECDIQARPSGGEQAQVMTLATKKQNGWISDREAMEELGNPDPQRTLQWRMQELVLANPQLHDALMQAVLTRTMSALTNSTNPALPANPLVSSGLAAALGGTTGQALLPDMGMGSTLPGAMPLGGAPNMGVPPVATGAPAPRSTIEGASMPGTVPGVAQGLPGGIHRQSDLLSRQR